MDKRIQLGLAIGVIIVILIGLCSCQMAGGLCRDIESAARYGHTHIICEE